MRAISFTERLRMARSGVFGVLKRPKYFALMLFATCVFAAVIYLSINWGLYGSLLFGSSLSLTMKVLTVWMMTVRMVMDVATPNGVLLLIVSILQGSNIALLIYTMKRNRQTDTSSKKANTTALSSSGFAAIAATLGLGCVPCGTSIILPVVSLFFSSSAYAAAEAASIIFLILAFIVSWYALYKVGFIAFAFVERDRLTKE